MGRKTRRITKQKKEKLLVRRFDGHITVGQCVFSDMFYQSGCRKHVNAKGAVTTCCPGQNASQLRHGGPLFYGSVTAEECLPRHVYTHERDTLARLGVVQTPQLPPENRPCPMQFCRELQKKERDELAETDALPLFYSSTETIDAYSRHANAFWGIFYAEFYRMVNFILKHSPVFFPANYGFEWTTNASGFGMMVDDSRVTSKSFVDTWTAVVTLIDNIVNDTPCLVHPVGMQVLLVDRMRGIEKEIDRCLQIICARGSFLGEACPDTGEAKKKRHTCKTKRHWNMVRDMILNLKGAHYNAALLMACLQNMRKKFMGEEGLLVFGERELEEAMDEEPLLYGYKLRAAELLRSILSDRPSGWRPFDFYGFSANLASRTSVALIEYLPSVISLTDACDVLKLPQLIEYYRRAFMNGLGMRNKAVMLNMVARMEEEIRSYPPSIKNNPDSREEFVVVSVRAMRIEGGLTEVTSMTDLHLQDREIFFSLWCSVILRKNLNHALLINGSVADFEPPSSWKPYSDIPLKWDRLVKAMKQRASTALQLKWAALAAKLLSARRGASRKRFKAERCWLGLAEKMLAACATRALATMWRKQARVRAAEMGIKSARSRQMALTTVQENTTVDENRQDAFEFARVNALRCLCRSIEFFFANLLRDPFLLSFYNPHLRTLPYAVFCDPVTFPSLVGLIVVTRMSPMDAIYNAVLFSGSLRNTEFGISST